MAICLCCIPPLNLLKTSIIRYTYGIAELDYARLLFDWIIVLGPRVGVKQ